MNIIQNNKYLIYLGILLLSISNSSADSIFKNSIDYSFSITASVNAFPNLPIKNSKHTAEYSPSLQFMVLPGHKLNIGIETSKITLSRQNFDTITSFGATHFKGSLNAIPIILIFNKRIWKIDLYGGLGVSWLKSTIDAFGTKAVSMDWHYCYFYSVGYTWDFNNRFGLGIDIKAYSFPKINKNIGGLALKFCYRI